MRFTKLREERGVTVRAVARAIGVSHATVATWFNGRSSPRLSDAVLLADYFKVSLDALAGRELIGSDLAETEQRAVEMVRALRLTKDEVLQRLSAAPVPTRLTAEVGKREADGSFTPTSASKPAKRQG